MNRQARVVSTMPSGTIPITDWVSYGDVTFFDAARQLALEESDFRDGVCRIKIEVRDEHDRVIPPAMFDLEVTREARILNPRRDTDNVENDSKLLSGILDRAKGVFSW